MLSPWLGAADAIGSTQTASVHHAARRRGCVAARVVGAAACGRKQSEAFEMDMDISTIDGSCHCGTVRFRIRLTNGLHTARRCTCSYCRMRGAIAVSADLGGVDILSGEEALSLYKFNTGTAKHLFCSKCGIYTHHQRRSNPNQYGVEKWWPIIKAANIKPE